jgi:hypothetical protein
MPHDLDDESIDRIARSFYVVRMVRYALLLVAALVVAGLSAGAGAPVVVPVVLGLLALVFATTMLALRRRYVSSQRRPAGSPSSPSPRG